MFSKLLLIKDNMDVHVCINLLHELGKLDKENGAAY